MTLPEGMRFSRACTKTLQQGDKIQTIEGMLSPTQMKNSLSTCYRRGLRVSFAADVGMQSRTLSLRVPSVRFGRTPAGCPAIAFQEAAQAHAGLV